MDLKISHNRDDVTLVAKAKWFQGLTLSERMDVFCDYVDLLLTLNPALAEKKDALGCEINWKFSTGQAVDPEDVRILKMTQP